MDYCDQGDLKCFIKRMYPKDRQFLCEREAQMVLRDVVRGLAHLTHICKVMHRDIKLDNILVKSKYGESQHFDLSEYEFKLGDLGLAKAYIDG